VKVQKRRERRCGGYDERFVFLDQCNGEEITPAIYVKFMLRGNALLQMPSHQRHIKNIEDRTPCIGVDV
jgi:hypothetical protein